MGVGAEEEGCAPRRLRRHRIPRFLLVTFFFSRKENGGAVIDAIAMCFHGRPSKAAGA
jgi:hypothetical protein